MPCTSSTLIHIDPPDRHCQAGGWHNDRVLKESGMLDLGITRDSESGVAGVASVYAEGIRVRSMGYVYTAMCREKKTGVYNGVRRYRVHPS